MTLIVTFEDHTHLQVTVNYAVSMAISDTFKDLLDAVTATKQRAHTLVITELVISSAHLQVPMHNIMFMTEIASFQNLLNAPTRKTQPEGHRTV